MFSLIVVIVIVFFIVFVYGKFESVEFVVGSLVLMVISLLCMIFNEELELVFSMVYVMDVKGNVVSIDKVKVDIINFCLLIVNVFKFIVGMYLVEWVVMIYDGYKIKGRYNFMVK